MPLTLVFRNRVELSRRAEHELWVEEGPISQQRSKFATPIPAIGLTVDRELLTNRARQGRAPGRAE